MFSAAAAAARVGRDTGRAGAAAMIGATALIGPSAVRIARLVMAKISLRALRRMMQYCVSVGLVEIDPTIGVQAPRLRSTGIHSWSEEEIEQYRRYHLLGSTARAGLELLLGTGQRRSDVVRLGRQHLHDGRSTLPSRRPAGPATFPSVPN